MLRLASLREQKMGEAEAAIEGYREVLDRDPTNEAALTSLERLGSNAEQELVIAEILEPHYRNQGDYEKLIGVHEVQVRRSDDVNTKVELLHQIAALYDDAAGDPSAAFDTTARALAADPSSEMSQEGLDRLARLTNRFADMAKVLEELAAKQEDPELGSALYSSAARVVQDDMGDIEGAIRLYGCVLSVDETNLPAAESLQGLYQTTERYAEMSEILQRKSNMLEDLDEQKAALYQAATREEDLLERQEMAVAIYKKVLALDEEDVKSIDALIGLFLAAETWTELLDVYAKKADLVFDPDEKKAIYYQVGAVYERELGDVVHAIDTYQRVLELDPDDLTALGRLDVLYQSAENWAELLSVLTQESELTADPAEAVSYQYRIAELYEKRLDDVVRAVELYRDILNIQTDHEPTLTALEGIKGTEGENALAAATVLETVYDAMGEYDRLISVLEVQANCSEDSFSQVELLHRIAALYEESLGNLASAFDVFGRAVAVDSENEDSLGSLERLAMTIERWPQVAELYDSELKKLEDEPDRLVGLVMRVAQVYEVQLEDVDNAVARYRTALEHDPENQAAVRALDRLFTSAERWSDLAEVLIQEADIGQSPDEILDFKYRLGEVFQLRLDDVDKAIEAYSEVINAAPEHEEALAALESLFAAGVKQLAIAEIVEPLYQASAEWEKLIQVHEAQPADAYDGARRARRDVLPDC